MEDAPVLQTEPQEGVPDVIDTLEGFEAMCERFAQGSGSLAADAERASGYRYGHEDWLVQFKREGAGIALADPVALGNAGADWGRFNDAIGDATWILHDSPQDLPGFFALGMEPQRLFDTEMAARLLGLRRFGLAYVTEHYLGVRLAKEHSAADWSYRPLPRDWRSYAALDVELLIELEDIMTAELKAAGKYEWALQEFSYMLAQGRQGPRRHAVPWMHVSHITALHKDGQGLAVVKALWTKRDELARRYDISPSLLLSDRAIIEAAQKKPRNARAFRAIRSLNERVRMQLGTEQDKMYERYAPIQRQVKPSVWKETIQEALALPRSEWPELPSNGGDDDAHANAPKNMRIWKTHHPRRYERLQRARKEVASIAQDVQIAPDVLLKPAILRNLCWANPSHLDVPAFLADQGARPWQIELVSASLSRVIM